MDENWIGISNENEGIGKYTRDDKQGGTTT